MIDIKRLTSDMGINQKSLAEFLKVAEPNITRLKNGSMKIPPDWVDQIEKEYPNITVSDYVITKPKKKDEAVQVPFEDFEMLPYISVNAQAGYLDAYNDKSEDDYLNEMDVMLIAKQFEKGKFLVVEVNGDSMDDDSKRAICDGDKLLVKELQKQHWKNKLHFKNNIFVIAEHSGVVVKEIIDHDVENGIIICHSWNPSKPDYPISLDEVHNLFYVKKIIDRKIKF